MGTFDLGGEAKMRYWLKESRENKGLKHEEVADQSAISRPYYTLIEQGSKTPSVDVAKAIAKVLNVSWTNFFNEECSFREQTSKEVG